MFQHSSKGVHQYLWSIITLEAGFFVFTTYYVIRKAHWSQNFNLESWRNLDNPSGKLTCHSMTALFIYIKCKSVHYAVHYAVYYSLGLFLASIKSCSDTIAQLLPVDVLFSHANNQSFAVHLALRSNFIFWLISRTSSAQTCHHK